MPLLGRTRYDEPWAAVQKRQEPALCSRLAGIVQPAAASTTAPAPRPPLSVAAVNKNTRHVDLRNAAPEEVLRQAVYLRSSLGRKASLQVRAERAGGEGGQWH